MAFIQTEDYVLGKYKEPVGFLGAEVQRAAGEDPEVVLRFHSTSEDAEFIIILTIEEFITGLLHQEVL